MSRAFVYLVIDDREVSNFLRRLRAEINGADVMWDVHLTVRGPYDKSQAVKKSLQRWQNLIDCAPVVVSGVGAFHNERESVVYLKVQHEYLRRIWWKPDFPVSKFGFNPHLTLYAGADKNFATDIHNLLSKQKLSLISHSNKIVLSTSKQSALFSNKENLNSDYLKLLQAGRVPLSLLQEVSDVRRRYFR